MSDGVQDPWCDLSYSCFVILLYLESVAVPDETTHDPHLEHCTSFYGAALGNLRRLILFFSLSLLQAGSYNLWLFRAHVGEQLA